MTMMRNNDDHDNYDNDNINDEMMTDNDTQTIMMMMTKVNNETTRKRHDK